MIRRYHKQIRDKQGLLLPHEVASKDPLHYVIMWRRDRTYSVIFQLLGDGVLIPLGDRVFPSEHEARLEAILDGTKVLNSCPVRSFTIDGELGRIL